MITRMTRYDFILLSGQTEEFLTRLQELGVVDITRSVKAVDDKSAAMLAKIGDIRRAISALEALDYSKDPDRDAVLSAAKSSVIDGCKMRNTLDSVAELASLEASKKALVRELRGCEVWGDYDQGRIDTLKAAGIDLHFYCVSLKKVDSEWKVNYALQIIESDSDYAWFVVAAPAGEPYDFPVAETEMPSRGAVEVRAAIDALQAEIIAVKARLQALRDIHLPHMKEGLARHSAELDRYFAASAAGEAAEGHITTFTGFAPSEDDARLKAEFDAMDLIYVAEAAVTDDNPPIKLHNNWFSRQFELFTGMYGMPSYNEFDPTPVLAPFFLLFFSMCMGDGGYGLVLILAALVLKYKMGDSALGKMHSLVMLLGIGTTVVGCLLGTFFGIPLYEASWVPVWMKRCMLVEANVGKIAGFDPQIVFTIGLGIFHICLAMVVKTICVTYHDGLKNNLSTWGWTILIVGLVVCGGLAVGGLLGGEALKWTVIAIGVVSALGIYIFNKPGRNPLINIGAGLWDTYNMATGLLGDTLSYLRLYALGLAGGMLGGAFNQLGGMLLGDNPTWQWLPCVIILLIGHGLNLAMSCLGAFVHPLRLSFVEYFKNVGYDGKGLKYNPLKK